MNPFKVGDRVRFIDNELNRTEIATDYIDKSFKVKSIDGNGLHLGLPDRLSRIPVHYSRFELAEPAAKFANVQVGDWVELSNRKITKVKRIEEDSIMVDYDYAFFNFNGEQINNKCNLSIIRIVPPEEVEVEITLKGTVRWLNKNFETIRISSEDNYFVDMSINQLSPDQVERVKAILKAQEKAE